MIRFLSALKAGKLALRARCLVERCVQSLGKLQCIVVSPEMQEEQSRLLIQHVAVDRGHIDPVRPQRRYDRVYFVARKHEIAGNSGLATASRLEVDRRGYAHRSHRSNLHSAFIDRIAPRHIKLVDAAVGLPFASDELIKLCRVEINRGWRSGCGWRR